MVVLNAAVLQDFPQTVMAFVLTITNAWMILVISRVRWKWVWYKLFEFLFLLKSIIFSSWKGGNPAICSNSAGTFECSCQNGYEPSDSTRSPTCINIDECQTSDPCSILTGNPATCTDTVGSFNCSCNTGFQFGPDESTCEDINECSDPNACKENSSCANTIGSFECPCNAGFISNGDGCADVDECTVSDPCNIQNGNSAVCNNMIGSFNCTCQAGFSQALDGVTCSDVDECSQSGICGDNSACANNDGSFICSCQNGFEPDTGTQDWGPNKLEIVF